MVKQGPCCHCGITTTPLWRNGPPDKPVLCNACGSRWRTKGTLKNYVPMHSGGFGIATKNNVSCDWFRDKSGHQDLSKGSFNKRSYKKYANNQREPSSFMKENQDVRSNMSTMGFCINELPMTNSNCYNSEHRPLPHFVPSKKRTLRTRYRASREKLKNRKTTLDDLQTFSSTCLPKVEIAIERSLKENFTQEIQLSLLGTEEGSKFSKTMCMKSSTDLNIKFLVQLAHSPSPSKRLAGGKEDKQAWKKFEGGPVHSKRISIPNKALLENFPYSKRDVLSSSQSPLIFLELKDILNFDTFTSLLSDQERGQLMQFVSFADFSNIPDSLKRMFKSSQFEGALANFQQLLSEGMFDYSELGISPNVLGHYQQLLDLTDLAASGWMEHCSQLQTRSTRRQPLGLSRGYQIKKKTKKKARKPLEHIGSASADCADGKFLSGWHPRKLPQKNNGGLDGNSISSVGASSSPQHRRVYPEIGGGRFSHAVRSGKLRSFSDESHSIKLSPGARSYFISKNFSRAQIERKLFSESIYSTILSENGEENDDDNGMLVNVPSNMYYQEAVLLQEPHSKSNEPKGSLDNSDSKDFVHKFNY